MTSSAVKSEVKSEANGPENHQNQFSTGRGGRGGVGRGGRGGGRPSRFQGSPGGGRGRPDVCNKHLRMVKFKLVKFDDA